MKDIETLSHQELLTINEAARLFGIGKGTLRNAVNEPNCPYSFKIGNRNLIIKDVLKKQITDCRCL